MRLEELSDTGPGAEGERRLIWQGLMESFNLSQDDLERFLVAKLNCQTITARRWITGKYTPRKLAITNLRRLWCGSDTGGLAEPEETVNFDGSKIEIHTLRHFFSKLEHAKFCLCAKGWLGYRAGRHPGARDEMVRILTEHSDLEVHYVFSPESEAQKSLERFLTFLSDRKATGEGDLLRQVYAWTTSDDPEFNDGLRYNIASPFILIYSDEGAKILGRSLDIWYELPVAAQSSRDGASSLHSVEQEHILVELPNHDALDLWRVWRILFAKILKENNKRRPNKNWQDNDWRQHLLGLLTLSNEQVRPGPSLEKLSDVMCDFI